MEKASKFVAVFIALFSLVLLCCGASFAVETKGIVDCMECNEGAIQTYYLTTTESHIRSCTHYPYGSDTEILEYVWCYEACNNCGGSRTDPSFYGVNVVSVICNGYN